MKRVGKIAGIGLFVVVALLVLMVALVLGTQAGSRWALALVPGLQVDTGASAAIARMLASG